MQSRPLLDTIGAYGFDAVLGGGRRDEERARAKERIFSLRNAFGQWDPRRQRPELWNIDNGRHRPGEHMRVFPLSNWTELDVWRYIAREDVELPSIYFAHQRVVYRRDGMPLAEGPWGGPRESTVRYRTVGDGSCTGAAKSTARTVDEVIAEIAASRVTERGASRVGRGTAADIGLNSRIQHGPGPIWSGPFRVQVWIVLGWTLAGGLNR